MFVAKMFSKSKHLATLDLHLEHLPSIQNCDGGAEAVVSLTPSACTVACIWGRAGTDSINQFRAARFLLVQVTKTGKTSQITIKSTGWPLNTYTNIVDSKIFQN
jgi:hypothetical protein